MEPGLGVLGLPAAGLDADASAGDVAFGGVDHVAGALQDFWKCGAYSPDRVVVEVEA